MRWLASETSHKNPQQPVNCVGCNSINFTGFRGSWTVVILIQSQLSCFAVFSCFFFFCACRFWIHIHSECENAVHPLYVTLFLLSIWLPQHLKSMLNVRSPSHFLCRKIMEADLHNNMLIYVWATVAYGVCFMCLCFYFKTRELKLWHRRRESLQGQTSDKTIDFMKNTRGWAWVMVVSAAAGAGVSCISDC